MTPTPDRTTRRELTSAEPRLRARGAGQAGWLEGYAAIFGNIDATGETVRRGAFAKSLRERLPAGRIALMIRHVRDGGDALEVVGKVTQAREDDVGLWVHAEFGSDATSQAARGKVLEGLVTGLSIGYVPLAGRETVVEGRRIYELTEVKLLEVTLTAFPANDLAGITAAKSIPGRPACATVPSNRSPEASPSAPAPTDWSLAIARRRLTLHRLTLDL
jgi:HK97 family phage prohead protease